MDTRQDDVRRDLDAAVQTRVELGKVGPLLAEGGEEGESEIIDSFLTRLDARVEQRVAERLGQTDAAPPHRSGRSGSHFKLQVLSLVFAIPLTGIAAGTGGLTGLVVCWAGIVGANVSSALSERGRQRRRGEWV